MCPPANKIPKYRNRLAYPKQEVVKGKDLFIWPLNNNVQWLSRGKTCFIYIYLKCYFVHLTIAVVG